MPRMRNRGEQCPRCKQMITVAMNLDTQEVAFVPQFDPEKCIANRVQCIQNVAAKALLAPFEDGKERKGF